MSDLLEKQYELGGVRFGTGSPVEILADGFTISSAAARTQDVDNPTGDGVRFGRDYKGSATWGFSMYSNASNEEEAWDFVRPLATAWDAEETRLNSGAVVPLRYKLAGQTRIVYGRPRRWSAVYTNALMGGRIDIEADFATVDDRSYSDVENSVPISLLPPTDPTVGVVAPFLVPFSSGPGSSVRQSSIYIGGDTPTPIWLTFVGEIDDAFVRAGDYWTAGLPDRVNEGNPVTIDARPWVRAATQSTGGGVRVNPRLTRISKMYLPPGYHELTFTGTDRIGNATALVGWRDAYKTPR